MLSSGLVQVFITRLMWIGIRHQALDVQRVEQLSIRYITVKTVDELLTKQTWLSSGQ